jgi:diguanylate cyclase (GGDEF)-like protein
MYLSDMLSLFFFGSFCVYLFMGVYVINLNRRAILNRLFLVMALLMGIWAFSFSIATSAPTHEIALEWRKIAAIGWGTIFSVILHFFLVLTEHRSLRKWWVYLLIYIPAIWNLCVYLLINSVANQMFRLVKTDAGWANVSVNNWIDWLYYLYYIGFTLTGLILLFRHSLQSSDHRKRKQALLITSSFLIAIVVGSATDIFINRYLQNAVLQFAPLVMLLPAIACLLAIRLFGFMKRTDAACELPEDELLNDHARKQIQKYVAISFMVGACFNFVAEYFVRQSPLGQVIGYSLLLSAFGGIIMFLEMPNKSRRRDYFLTAILSLAVPVLVLNYVSHYASLTIWAAPFLFISLLSVYSKGNLFYMLSFSIFASLLFVWWKKPLMTVEISWIDHSLRIFLFAATLHMAHFVNRAFHARLQHINHLAYYDTLTGLPNRITFRYKLEGILSTSPSAKTPLAVMCLDLDTFKTINSTLGYAQGDELLKLMAARLSAAVKLHGLVSRFDGDEFWLLLSDPSCSVTQQVNTVLQALQKPFVLADQDYYFTVSAGAAQYPRDGRVTDDLINHAGLAMNKAKERGRAHFLWCSADMKEEESRQIQLTHHLYRALEHGELVVYYQPQVSLADGSIKGMEALLRWVHPEYGMISPSIFIPLAEKTGLIHDIGFWVLKTACQQAVQWRSYGHTDLTMAVNLSVDQLLKPGLVDSIWRVLSETGMNPTDLELELTESVAMDENLSSIAVLHQIKQLGVTLAIDDFGTAYSSLSRLKNLPIDRLKLAMPFVHGIGHSEKDEAIIDIILHLAESLHVRLIAEGVENNQQLQFLHQHHYREVQGYYFHKPMIAAQAEQILMQQLAKMMPPNG